jgi:mRNA interferase RelE/StbE
LAELLPEKVAAAAYKFITGPLLDDPHRVGKPLDPPMAPAWTARRGTYRILYRLDEARGIVEVTAIRHRSDVASRGHGTDVIPDSVGWAREVAARRAATARGTA